MSSSGPHDWIGQTLADRYHVTEKIGAGGMGTVFKASDTRLDDEVVVKAPHPVMIKDAEFAARFKREIQSLVKLSHPNIVKVMDVGDHDGLQFAVMQFLDGGSLDDRSRPCTPEEVTDWLPDVAAALDFIHLKRFIHRDIKPSNILFDSTGSAYLGDFGIAKVMAEGDESDEKLTGTGSMIGTAEYMAPEMLVPSAFKEAYNQRADQYSLAVTVYEMLAGRPPFRGDSMAEVAILLATKKATALQERNSAIPEEVSRVVARALRKKPGKRFESCQEFANSFVAAVGGELLPPGSGDRPAKRGSSASGTVPRQPTLVEATRSPEILRPATMQEPVSGPSRRPTMLEPVNSPELPGTGPDRGDTVQSPKRKEQGDSTIAERELLRSQHVSKTPGQHRGFIHRRPWLEQQRVAAEVPGHGGAMPDALAGRHEGGRGLRSADPEHGFRADLVRTGGAFTLRGFMIAAVVVLPALVLLGFMLVGGDEDEVVPVRPPAPRAPRRGDAVLRSGTVPPLPEPVSPGSEPNVPGRMEITNSIGMKLRLIPAGEFMMGSPGTESYRGDETQHRVTLTKPFYMGETEVTLAEYLQVMGTNPSEFQGLQNPVETVSWADAVEFCGKLSAMPAEKTAGIAEHVYRLPTEAEWEYACRSGTTTAYGFGDDASRLGDYGWSRSNSYSKTHPVGENKPNAWGLYDMHGGVYEWCQDWYGAYPSGSATDPTGATSGSLRVNRGGSWISHAGYCRSANRSRDSPEYRGSSLGFRVLRSSMKAAAEKAAVEIAAAKKAVEGQEPLTLKGHSGGVWSVRFGPDGKRIVSGGDPYLQPGEIKVWDSQTGEETLALNGHTERVSSVSFSPDGKRIVSGSRDKTLKVWDAETGQEMLTLKGHSGPVDSVSFSPDGKRIVSGGDVFDTTVEIKVWDAETGHVTLTLKGHSGLVDSVSFSPDGKWIVSGSFDKTMKIWDSETGRETATLKGHTSGVRSVSFSPDGKRIVSGSRDTTLKVWDWPWNY